MHTSYPNMQLTAEMPTLNIKALIKVNILTKFIKRGWFINLLGIFRGDGDVEIIIFPGKNQADKKEFPMRFHISQLLHIALFSFYPP